MTNSYNYKTYYKGTPKDLESSDTIFLTKSSYFNLSIDNLDNILSEIESDPNKVKEVSKTNDAFSLSLNNEIFKFDVIFYKKAEKLLGYTLFFTYQKCYSSSGIPFTNLKIAIIFSKTEGGEPTLSLERKNKRNTEVESNAKISGDNRYNYIKNKSLVNKELEDQYIRFTNRPRDFYGDSTLNILTDTNIIYQYYGVTSSQSSFLLSGIDINSDYFSTYIITTIDSEDVALLEFSFYTGEYNVISLTTLNSFKRPYSYLSGEIETYPEDVKSFLGGTGKVLLFDGKDNYIIYSMENKEFSRYPKVTDNSLEKTFIILDPSKDTNIRYLRDKKIKEEISDSCIVPTTFSNYSYKEKIGDWWIFTLGSYYLHTSVYGYIISKVKMKFVNSRLAYFKETKNKETLYHILPIEFGHYYIYNEETTRFEDPSARNSVSDIIIDCSNSLSDISSEKRCLLNGLRRKPIRLSECFPSNIIGTLFGIIYYIDSSDNLLYCY